MSRWFWIIAFCLIVAGTATAQAQGLGLASQNSDSPLEIFADDGIEWEQDAKRMVARGNARAERGNVVVRADTLVAYYNTLGADGAGDITMIEALGNVRISSPKETAYGDSAKYDVQKAVLVLWGKDLRLVSDKATITASESLEYWDERHQAVARGNATATRDGRTLQARVLTADFLPDPKTGDIALSVIKAFDNVVVTTPEERATAQKGAYDVKSGIAVLEGSVKINRGGNELTGEYATVNLDQGKSTIYASKPKTGKTGTSSGDNTTKRVKMFLVPSKDKTSGKTPDKSAPKP
ncbi:MAG: hypothetical protein A2516_03610 [Alphaproteobacteria bacterium RIFOXYD12_FULL_60_8]|nr:MAG: hypothetical protein A2516_03610 [Alphaproteobacteria bacterium RIFOXYD12_FULL_60_8]